MSMPGGDGSAQGAFPWVLEHLLAYPGTYEIPLRTMYTLNTTTQTQPQSLSQPASPTVPGNAFPRTTAAPPEDQQNSSTVSAAAQLRANLMTHIAQLPSQPTSLPPSFITAFVRKTFPPELDQVEFTQALTALDYLKDLEIRRRREVVTALDKLGIERDDLSHRDKLAQKYPGVMLWVMEIEEKERRVEALYTQVYVGLRRWTMINELSLAPFNKPNCIAMLNTLYPPIVGPQFVQPTAQLTAKILTEQRDGFFRYVKAVEKGGPTVLSSLINQSRRPGDPTGWTGMRETVDTYVCMANTVIDECYEITGRGNSPTAASFSSADLDLDGRRKVDSAISFGSGNSSNRNSGQSHTTRPSTSSSFSASGHSRQASREKNLPEKPLPPPKDDDATITPKIPGSALERIARELRKIRSRNNVKEDSRPRLMSNASIESSVPEPVESRPGTPGRERGLSIKRSIRRMRSNTNLDSRPQSRAGEAGFAEMPAFDAEQMKRSRQQWEAQHKKGMSDQGSMIA